MQTKNSIFTHFKFLTIMLLLSACQTNVAPMESLPTAATLHLTPTPAATPTLIPTSLPSPAPIITQEISRSCLVTDKNDISMSGVFVFSNLSPDMIRTIFLRDSKPPNLKTLSGPGPLVHFWGISSDRKQLLYQYDTLKGGDYRMGIANANGKTILDFDDQLWSDDWWDYFSWFDDQRLRVVRMEDGKVFPHLYNPFTKEYKVLRTDWPDSYKGENLDWGLDWIAVSTLRLDGANIVYDPTLTRVLYPKKGEIVSLTDVESNPELASIQLPHWGKIPRWSQDGKNLVLVASTQPNSTKAADDFFIISRDGSTFKQLTHLSNTFNQVTISEYAWSPDGKQIAFLLNTDPGDPNAEGTQSELAVLDIQTGEITNLCFQAISAVTHLEGPVLFASTQPIWSPDGTQLMVAQWDPKSSEINRKYSVWVIDIPSLSAKKIDENKQPVGWMIKTP
jgi:hypothetical protein